MGETGRRPVGRRGASAVRKERVDLSFVLRDCSRLCRAAPTAARRRTADSAPGCAAGPRAWTWRSSRSTDDDGDRAGQDQQEQRVDRPAGDLSRQTGDLQLDQRALWFAVHLRQAESSVLYAWREERPAEGAGPVHSARKNPSRERRWVSAEGQPIR